jgi:hypothetical protein
MKLNPTLLKSILAFLVSLFVYLWVKYGKRIMRWWKEMPTRHRRWSVADILLMPVPERVWLSPFPAV